jgi:hypothetical protein
MPFIESFHGKFDNREQSETLFFELFLSLFLKGGWQWEIFCYDT